MNRRRVVETVRRPRGSPPAPSVRRDAPVAVSSRGPGRPRSREAHAAILRAAIELVREVGYEAVAMDAIAERAGVSKPTVYRRWPGKEALVAEAVDQIVSSLEVPDTGTTHGDLVALLEDTIRLYRDPATTGLLAGFVSAMARSDRIARRLRTGFIAARRDATRRVLLRGVERGEVNAATDIELAIDTLGGPLVYRALITGAPVRGLASALADLVLHGLAPRTTPARGARPTPRRNRSR